MRLPFKLSWLAAAALAVGFSGSASAQSAADRAVAEAKQYSGTTITIVWEAGLQALDPLNFSGPKWKELTGIEVKVVEVPTAEMFTKIMQDYRSGAGAYDALERDSRLDARPGAMPARSSRWTPMSTSTAIATSCRRSRPPIATTR